MKNVQIIDGAVNATFSVFQTTEEECAAIFPDGKIWSWSRTSSDGWEMKKQVAFSPRFGIDPYSSAMLSEFMGRYSTTMKADVNLSRDQDARSIGMIVRSIKPRENSSPDIAETISSQFV